MNKQLTVELGCFVYVIDAINHRRLWQVVMSRGELMKQAEKLLDELGWSKAVLEIQYEHEVWYLQYDIYSMSMSLLIQY